MNTFDDLFSDPFPKFVYEILLDDAQSAGSAMSHFDGSRIFAIRAIMRGDREALLQNLTGIWNPGNAVHVASRVFMAANRVALWSDVLSMVRPVFSYIEGFHANKIQLLRVENALTKGFFDLLSAYKASPNLVPKQVILINKDSVGRGFARVQSVGFDLAKSSANEFAEYPEAGVYLDSGVPQANVDRQLATWKELAKRSLEFDIYSCNECVLTAFLPTPMLDLGTTLAALGSCIDYYHHARWVGATLSHSKVQERLDEAIVFPRAGAGFHYHQMIDLIAMILALETVSWSSGDILVADDLTKFEELFAALGIDKSRIRSYANGPAIRIGLSHLVPQASYSRAKIARARQYIFTNRKTNKIGNKIYISRSRSPQRPLVNEREIEGIVEAAGYQVFHFEDMSVIDQICLVENADFVIAPHGGGIANLLFAPTPLKLLELSSESYLTGFFYQLANSCGFQYSIYVGSSVRAKENGVSKGEWSIDAAQFREALAEFEKW